MMTKRIGLRIPALTLMVMFGLMACEDEPTPPPEPGTISGTVTVDGVGVSGITVDLSGLATANAMTDGTGGFTFANLEPGDYTVTISGSDSELVTFDQTSAAVTLESAGMEMVAFAGTPTGVQRVQIYAYYGIDGTKPNVAPAPGFQVDIFPTEFDRDSQTNRLGRATTDTNGLAEFTYNRSADTDNGGGATDNTIYTRVTATPGPRQIGQTDLQQTINYQSHEVVAMAPDTMDMLNGEVTASLQVLTIETTYSGPEGSGLPEPGWVFRSRTDTAAAGVDSDDADGTGIASFELFTDVANLPVTVYFRLDDSQPGDAGNVWTQTPEPTAASSGAGRHLVFVHDGTRAPGGVDLGVQRVEYVTQALFVPVHHESDLGEADPVYTPSSDDTDGATNIQVEVLADDQTTVLRTATAASNGHVVWNGPNAAGPTADSLNAQSVYYVRASSLSGNISIVTPTIYRVGQAGGGSVGTFGPGEGGFRHSARVCPLGADTVIANCSAFAYKYNNTTVTGTITSGGSPVSGMTVDLYRCVPPDSSSCTRDGDPISVTTNGLGVFTFSGNLEDIYEIAPDAGSAGFTSTSAVGGSPIVVTQGSGDVQTRNFTAS